MFCQISQPNKIGAVSFAIQSTFQPKNLTTPFSGGKNSAESEHLKQNTDEERSSLVEQAAQLRKGGRSIREIAAQLGVSKSLIGKILKKNEVSTDVHPSTVGDSVDNVDSNQTITPDATLFQP